MEPIYKLIQVLSELPKESFMQSEIKQSSLKIYNKDEKCIGWINMLSLEFEPYKESSY